MIKVDLHLHSKFSDKSAGFFSKKLDMHESYVTPKQLYDTLFERGMTHFTITDHDQIGGCLEIAHLPGVFISEEATAYFPEDRCRIHVLCYDITVEQHEAIQQLRYNVYDLVDYLQAQNILHVFAHPLYDMDGRLNETHIERCLLMFDNWEIINGTRSGISAKLTQEITEKFSVDGLLELERKYGFNKRRRSHISFTGGSDDHGGMDAGRTYTKCPGESLEDFKAAFERGTTVPHGEYGSPIRLTHMIMGISHQWGKAKKHTDSHLLDYLFGKPKMNMVTRLLGMKKVLEQVQNISGIRSAVSAENKHDVIHGFFKNLFPHLMKEFSDKKNLDMERVSTLLGQSMLSVIPTAYYLSVYWQRAYEKKRSRQIYRAVTGEKKDYTGKVAYFTDTFNEINGVALTSKKLFKLVKEKGYKMTFITAYPEQVDDPYRKNFDPIFSFSLPEYEEIPVNIPHFLDMLEYCDDQNFDVIYASTPGVVGLYAFFIAKILHIPYVTTFHTDFPDYIGKYSGDHLFKGHIWNAFSLLFNNADRVLSPSKIYRKTLIVNGVKKKKVETFTRGVNFERFNPEFRDRSFWKKFDPSYSNEKVILFVGRIAKEKNLDLFVQVHEVLKERDDLKFIIVGDGPYMKTINTEENRAIIKTGFLEGEELSIAFASADIFLFPSQTETFGNVVLEAQASGTVPVVSSVGAVKESVVDHSTGFVIDGNNPFDYADAITKITDNASVLGTMRQNALNFMEGKGEEELLEVMLEKLSLGKLQKHAIDERLEYIVEKAS
ncbi:MAG: glycosyltransferase [Campylobacterota bacterium]|nr:glycosyltransferase [Campylobacterota bacterium]